jgi:hypothetical protein
MGTSQNYHRKLVFPQGNVPSVKTYPMWPYGWLVPVGYRTLETEVASENGLPSVGIDL